MNKGKKPDELIIANKKLLFQYGEKRKRAAELVIANKELIFQNKEKAKRAAELVIANKELIFQNKEKAKRAAELIVANKELIFQNKEKAKRAAELIVANKKLIFQNKEKAKRAAELIVANKELIFQNKEKAKRAVELIVANKKLIFQNEEKAKRAAELTIANKELIFQNKEKAKRAAELTIANKELAFQNTEKGKRAAELIIANKELLFQNREKEKRAVELSIANKELKIAGEKIRESERIYKTIASSIPGSMICLLDRDYRYLLMEGDMLEKLGYSKEIFLGNKAKDVWSPELYIQGLEDFKRVFNGEVFTTEDDLGEHHTITKFVPLKDENDKVYSCMVVVIDVTELKKAERQIAELNIGLEHKIVERTAQLQAVNKELESFSYSVSHDLRAPLRAINGFTQILVEDYQEKLDEEARDVLSVIIDNSKKMGLLIDNLLEFSRIGKQGISVMNVGMKELADSVVAELKQEYPNTEHQVNVKMLENIKGDKNMLKQVLINLISNALKYSGKKKEAMIEIGSYKKDNHYIYYIKDNGVGFDMLYYDKLFGVFQRLHSTDEFEGTGVGLAIVQRIITKHGGKVWAEGKVNEGACFYFSLPIFKSISPQADKNN